MNINLLTQKLSSDWGLKDGKVISSTIVKPNLQPSNAVNSKKQSQTCTDWYLVTTFYWADGSTSSFSQYAYTRCVDEQSFDPNGGGGSLDNIDLDSICAQSKRLATNAGFVQKLNDLNNATSLGNETGYKLVKNSSGGYTYTQVTGNSNSSNMTVPLSSMDGYLHNHNGTNNLPCFSPTDFQFLYLLLKTGNMPDPSNFIMGLVTNTGRIQLIRITDLSGFLNFGDQYLNLSAFGSWESSLNINTIDYTSTMKILLSQFQNAGLTFYESDINNISDGFKKVSYDQTNNAMITIKCSN